MDASGPIRFSSLTTSCGIPLQPIGSVLREIGADYFFAFAAAMPSVGNRNGKLPSCKLSPLTRDDRRQAVGTEPPAFATRAVGSERVLKRRDRESMTAIHGVALTARLALATIPTHLHRFGLIR